MTKWKNACEAYWWVDNHPKLIYGGYANPWIEITPHMVNPESNSIEDDESLNTKLRFWVEFGPYVEDTYHGGLIVSHDWELDCGGWTWEEACINLAILILEKYGDYEE
jgi:hypothetical protein